MKFSCFKIKFGAKSDQTNLLSNQLLEKEQSCLIKETSAKKNKKVLNSKPGIAQDCVDINAKSSSWFLPNVSEEKSAEILESLVPGRFLIRQVQNSFILHLRCEVGTESYLILVQDTGLRFSGADKQFSNLSSLVVHHSIMQEQLPTLLRVAEDIQEDEEIDFIDIDVDPEYNVLVSRLQTQLNSF